jgi:8-oxo-dGTP diphosphatase
MARVARELHLLIESERACRLALERLDPSQIARPAPTTSALTLQILRPRVGIACLLLSDDNAGRVLVGERMGSHGEGTFALPGGHLEPNQTFGACASMELAEECGLTLDESAWTVQAITNDVFTLEGLHFVTIFMRATISRDQLSHLQNLEPEKCRGWHWLTLADLKGRPLFLSFSNFLADESNLRELEKLGIARP